MEKVLRKHEVPESVRLAIARGDYDALSQLGKAGNRRKQELKPLRDQEVVRQTLIKVANDAAFDAEVQKVLEAEHRQMVLVDAYRHALSIDPHEVDD